MGKGGPHIIPACRISSLPAARCPTMRGCYNITFASAGGGLTTILTFCQRRGNLNDRNLKNTINPELRGQATGRRCLRSLPLRAIAFEAQEQVNAYIQALLEYIKRQHSDLRKSVAQKVANECLLPRIKSHFPEFCVSGSEDAAFAKLLELYFAPGVNGSLNLEALMTTAFKKKGGLNISTGTAQKLFGEAKSVGMHFGLLQLQQQLQARTSSPDVGDVRNQIGQQVIPTAIQFVVSQFKKHISERLGIISIRTKDSLCDVPKIKSAVWPLIHQFALFINGSTRSYHSAKRHQSQRAKQVTVLQDSLKNKLSALARQATDRQLCKEVTTSLHAARRPGSAEHDESEHD